MKVKFVVITTLAVLLLSSCRNWILEDRFNCPRYMFFKITNSEPFEERARVFATVFNYPHGEYIDSETTYIENINDHTFFFKLRGITAVQGYGLLGFVNETMDSDQKSWRIPLGEDSDYIFRFGYHQETDEESFEVPVEFTKEFSRVNVQFVGYETFGSVEGVFPFKTIITSNTCGIDGLTGFPLEGEFKYTPVEEEVGRFSFTLPRQGDQNLKIEIHGKPGVYERTGLIDALDLYKILHEKAGITWNEKNVPDLDITIDYQQLDVYVEVIEWDQQELWYEF